MYTKHDTKTVRPNHVHSIWLTGRVADTAHRMIDWVTNTEYKPSDWMTNTEHKLSDRMTNRT